MVLQAKLLIIGGVAVLVPVVGVTANEALKGPSAPEQEVPAPAPVPAKGNWTPLSDMPWFKALNLGDDTFGGKYGHLLLGADEPKSPTKPWQGPIKGDSSYTTETNKSAWEFKFNQYKGKVEDLNYLSDVVFACLVFIKHKVSDVESSGRARVPVPGPQNKTLQETLNMCSFSGPVS